MKIVFFTLTLLLFGCQSSSDSSPKKAEPQGKTSQTGKQLYTTHCTSCHGIDGKLGVSGASDLSKSNLSEQQVTAILSNGRNGMPAMKELLETHENMDSVINYVIQLR
jgi:cytochrome c6